MASSITAVRDRVATRLRRSGMRLEHACRYLFDRGSLIEAGQTPFTVIHSRGTVRLRYYPPLAASGIEGLGSRQPAARQGPRTPLVLVPPLAVNMRVYDRFPQRSLVRYLRARGFELYLVDWGEPGRAEDRLGLADYFGTLLPAMLERVRAHSGVRAVSLHGWSFGGLFSLCHAAQAAPGDIANLVLVGTPVDYHDNGVLGERYRALLRRARWLRRWTGLDAHRLPPGLLRSPGWLNALVFKATSPAASAKSYLGLLRNLHDEAAVRAHATQAAFLDDMVAYPGGVVADFIDRLWVDNVLGSGRLPVAGEAPTLAAVDVPIYNITGRGDAIVTPACSRAMTRFVASPDITCETVRGGHVGIVSSATARTETWGRIADWLIARD